MATFTPAATAPSVSTIGRAKEMAIASPGAPVVVRGTVTRYRSRRSIYLSDDTASIFVSTDGSEALAPGDVVEVTGVTGTDENGPLIAKATYRRIRTGDPPQPIAVSARTLARGQFSAELVSIDGELVRIDISRYEDALIVRSGATEFACWLVRTDGESARGIEPGSRIRVTGIASITFEQGRPMGFEVLMRSPADVAVTQPPSWWTSRRVGSVAFTFGSAAFVLLLYVVVLRHQVARQTAIIAERLRAESDLKEQYRQAQKMEAVGRLAGGIAHNFNNIMTIVIGYSEILAAELKDRPDLSEPVHEIQLAAARAAGLTGQLLAFSRNQKLQPTSVNLNEVIDHLSPLFMRLLGGDIAVDAAPDPGPVTIMADRAQLEQALLNLAVNARDAMPEGGRLRLSTSARQDADGRPIGVLLVTDTGTGISADAQAHVFEPFFTTKDVGAGSGLGLAMVYGFVQECGGTIRFETVAGQGTTFALTFPLLAVSPAAD